MSKLQDQLHKIAIKRLHLIPYSPGTSSTRQRLVFLSELAALGYSVTNSDAYTDSVLLRYHDLIKTLKEMRGGDVEHVPLFQGFPESTPEDDDYLIKRVLVYVGNHVGWFPEGRQLDSGIVIPEWLFDLNEFGADPVTQLQDKSLFQAGVKRQAKCESDDHVEWIHLRLATWDEVEDAARDLLLQNLYAKSSIKEALKDDLEILLGHFGTEMIAPDRLTFKETRTFVMKYFWNRNDLTSLRPLSSTPTDLLRLFASLTDTDVSLSDPIRFPKLKRGQRRFVLEVLEGCSNLEEDLNAYRGLWLEIGRFLHPGEYASRFPRVFAAFDALRNDRITTFNSIIEQAIQAKDVQTLLYHLSQRPGVFARRIHQLLELAGEHGDEVLNRFAKIANQVPLKNLLVLESHLRTIEESERRTVINKRGRICVLDNRPGRLSEEVHQKTLEVIRDAILDKIASEHPSWSGKRVWIDDALKNYTVPLQQRKASDGILTLGRGSQLPLDVGKVLRLFVYWKEASRTTDLDLSLIKYDDNLNYAGHVSYTNLKSGGIVHSGDLQSAPHGAAEFIDVELSAVRGQKDCRYLASQVYRYCGDAFGNMDCHAGWMIRDKVDSTYKSFDVKTVQNKFDLTGTTGYAIPIIVDLKLNRITFVDLYVGGVGTHNRVEGSYQDISTITREMVRMIDTRPNVHDLAHCHTLARKATLTQERTEADVTFGVDADCTYNVMDVQTILSELL